MDYIWQHKNFPSFEFDVTALTTLIQDFALQLGEVNGMLQGLSVDEKEDFIVQIMLAEALKTSEIEGEHYSRLDLMSSIRNHLGFHNTLPPSKDKNAESVAKMMFDVRTDAKQKISEQMILNWHSTLMEFQKGVNAGKWRKSIEPMQIISGRFGAIEVHFEAPPSAEVAEMMSAFVLWYQGFAFESIGKVGEAMLQAALTHLYFETIHPFEDGNGRIGRALAEKALAERLETPLYISLSKMIDQNKKAYYDALKKAQRSQDVTNWLVYFFNLIVEAEIQAKHIALFAIDKMVYFDRFKLKLNVRQHKAIQKMLDYGKNGFVGGMTAKKYMSINGVSKATATRDLQELLEMEALEMEGSGRSVHYTLNI